MRGVVLLLGVALHGAPGLVATSQTVTVTVTVVATLVVVGLAAAAGWLLLEAAALRRSCTRLRDETEALRSDLEAVAAQAGRALARVDDLVGSAESISDVVGSASRLASSAMAAPVIKAVALGTGAARAGRRLRQGPASGGAAQGGGR